MGRCRNDWYEPLTGKIALTATIGQRHAAEILWHRGLRNRPAGIREAVRLTHTV